MASITPGERSSGSIGHKDPIRNNTSTQMNGGVQVCYLMDCMQNISASYLKVGDESMSAIRFQTKVKGNLPHLPYI